MRKTYIDHLRSLTILLLFPVHTFMIWNDFGAGFYIWVEENKILSTGIVLVTPWFMPMLFVLAGISARFALAKRTAREFVMQRIHKLLVPFISGMILLVPFQTLYARKYFDGYKGGMSDHWKYFFTHFTDLNGYDGAFTPGHLWFILFLFVISVAALILFRFLPCEKFTAKVRKIPASGILFFFVPIGLMYYLGNFGGSSIGKSLALYLAGYYVLSDDLVIAKIEKNIKWLSGLCAIGTVGLAALYYQYSYYGDLWVNYVGWNTILVLLVLGKKFLNKRTRLTDYLNKASYPVYILHQSIQVVLAYYVVRTQGNMVVQAAEICIGSFLLTVLAYHLIRRIPVVRRMAGIYQR